MPNEKGIDEGIKKSILNCEKQEYIERLINYTGYIENIDGINFINKIADIKDILRDDEIIISIDTEYLKDGEKKASKKFSIIHKNELKKLKDISAYEVISQGTNRIYRFYLDIETIIKVEDIEKCDKMISDLIDETIKKVNTVLKYKCEITEIKKVDGSGQTPKGYKYSKHIYFPIYSEQITANYDIFTYLNKNIFSNFKYEKINIVDELPYIKSKNSTQQFRLLGQSKNGCRKLTTTENTADIFKYLVVEFDCNKPLIDIGKIKELLLKSYKYSNMIKPERSMKDINYITNAELNVFKNNKYQSIDELYNILSTSSSVEIGELIAYLNSIPNTPKKKMCYKPRFIILSLLKKIGNKQYENDDIFKELANIWYLKGYVKITDDKQVNFNKMWNSIITNKIYFGIPTFSNIASKYDKNIRTKLLFTSNYIKMYDIKKYIPSYAEIYEIKDKNERIDFIKYKNYKTIMTDVNIGEGKTEAFNKLLLESLNKDIKTFAIIFSNRILYGKEYLEKTNKLLLKNKYNPLIFYKDIKEKVYIDMTKYSGIIVSFESLTKQFYNIKKSFNRTIITFYDESETLIKGIVGTTNKNQSDTIHSLNVIWNKSKINIIADAYASIKSLEFIKHMNEATNRTQKYIYIHAGNRNLYPKTFTIKNTVNNLDNYDKLTQEVTEAIYKDIMDNKKIVVFAESATDINKIKSYLLYKKISPNTILCNTGRQKQSDTNEENIKNILPFTDKYLFNNYQIWLYNSSILNGVSVEDVKYDKGYLITHNFGNSKDTIGGNDCLNAIGRARQTTEWFIYMKLQEKQGNLISNYSLNIDEIDKINQGIITTSKYKSQYDNNTDYEDDIVNIDINIISYNYYINDPLNYRLSKVSVTGGGTAIRFYKWGNNKICNENIVFELPYEDYLEHIQNGAITRTLEEHIIFKNLINNNTYSTHFNLIFKKEVFILLAKNKGNIIIDENNNFKDDLKPLEGYNILDLPKIKYNINGTYNLSGFVNQDIEDNYNIQDINKYNDLINNLEDLNYLLVVNTSFKMINEKWKSIKTNSIINNYNPIYAKTLLNHIFKIKYLYELPENITTDYIISNKLYENHFINSTNFKKANGIRVRPITNKTVAFITEINYILRELGFYYQINHERTIRKTINDIKSYNNTYELKYTKYELSYKNTHGIICNLCNTIKHISKIYKWD
jgi:hypothetical protein